MWLRDILEELCRQKLRDITDFEWQKYMRPYLVQGKGEEEGEGEGEGEEGGEGGGEREGEGTSSTASIVLQCLDQRLSYGFEYQGTASLPVMTPRMDNYILAFTQVMCTCIYYIWWDFN
jgi:hypothetical protein